MIISPLILLRKRNGSYEVVEKIKKNVIISLFDLQLDAKNSYLFIYNTFIKILYMFRAYPAHLQEIYVVIVYIYIQPLVSSLSAGDCPVHRVRKNSSYVDTG
jgi:hypothetical protein